MARTPLFSFVKRALGLAKVAQDHNIPADQVEEWVEEKRANAMSRRAFFGKAAAASAGFALMGMAMPRMPKKSSELRVAIIGAGMAGLRAAHYLKQYGLSEKVTVYEASNRTGGRMFTRKLFGNSGTTEVGGEYIDYNHFDMLYLADLFGVKKLFRYKDKVKHPEAFLFYDPKKKEKVLYTHSDVVEQFNLIRKKVAEDSQATGEARVSLDNLKMSAYFEELGKIKQVEAWFIALLTAAYVGEMGLDLEYQSALNFIDLVGDQEGQEGFEFFGDSDESIKFLGGNQQLCDRLAEDVYQQIKLSMRLTKVESDLSGQTNKGFKLYFNGSNEPVYADVVIMTIPFTVLRKVEGINGLEELKGEENAVKRKCIEELGMGTNGKIFYDVKALEPSNERIWRTLGYQGYLYSENIHTGWDSYHMQNYNEGNAVYTVFLGGKAGEKVNAKNDYDKLIPDIDKAFPGSKPYFPNADDEKRMGQMNWTTNPYSLGSYICPRPGQVTEFVDDNVAATPAGNMFFAGEHTSTNFGGFMNGAAESGRLAAEQVLRRIWDDF